MVNHTTDIAFPGKNLDERFCFSFRQHWVRLTGPFTRLAFWTTFLLVAGYVTFNGISIPDPRTRHLVLMFFAAFFLFSQWEFLAALYRHFLYVIIVTDKKVHRIKRTLFLLDEHQIVDLRMLQDIQKSQRGPVQNMLGFGSLTLEAQETILKVHFTPRITRIYEELMHLRDKALMR